MGVEREQGSARLWRRAELDATEAVCWGEFFCPPADKGVTCQVVGELSHRAGGFGVRLRLLAVLVRSGGGAARTVLRLVALCSMFDFGRGEKAGEEEWTSAQEQWRLLHTRFGPPHMLSCRQPESQSM